MDYTFEYAGIQAFVSGRRKNKKGELEPLKYEVSSENVENVFKKIVEEFTGFKESVREIDDKVSSRILAVGIESCKEEVVLKERKVFRFSMRYILKEKEKYWLTDKKNLTSRPIEYKGSEYPSFFACVSFYPSENQFVIDRRATLGPLNELLSDYFAEYLDSSEFLIGKDEMLGAVKIFLRQELDKDYKEKIKKNFNKINKMSFTYYKPARVRKANAKKVKSNFPKELEEFIKKSLGAGSLKGQFMDLPIKSLSIAVKLDDNYEKEQLKEFKKTSKEHILKQIDDPVLNYLSGSVVEFDKADLDLKNAILRGVAKTSTQEMSKFPSDSPEDFFYVHDELFKIWRDE